MKTALLTLFLALTLSTARAEGDWLTNPAVAQAKAKRENKLVLMDFTGSDWCSWCKKLHKEVFSQPEFQAYAKTNLVLMEVDFPHAKKLPPEQVRINDALQRKYAIEGYPTIIVLNGDGRKVGTLGYMQGGPKAFIAALDKFKPKVKN